MPVQIGNSISIFNIAKVTNVTFFSDYSKQTKKRNLTLRIFVLLRQTILIK